MENGPSRESQRAATPLPCRRRTNGPINRTTAVSPFSDIATAVCLASWLALEADEQRVFFTHQILDSCDFLLQPWGYKLADRESEFYVYKSTEQFGRNKQPRVDRCYGFKINDKF